MPDLPSSRKPLPDFLAFPLRAWKLIWHNKSIWVFSALGVLSTLMNTSPDKFSEWMLAFACLSLVSVFVNFLLMLVYGIGSPIAACRLTQGLETNWAETITVIKKCLGRYLLLLLIIGACLLPFFCSSFVLWKTFPENQPVIPAIIFKPIALIAPMLTFSIYGVIVRDLSVKHAIKEGFGIYIHHLGTVLLVAILFAMLQYGIELIVGLGGLWAQSNFDPASLSGFNYLTPSLSFQESPWLVGIDALFELMMYSWTAVAWMLAYLKYNPIPTKDPQS